MRCNKTRFVASYIVLVRMQDRGSIVYHSICCYFYDIYWKCEQNDSEIFHPRTVRIAHTLWFTSINPEKGFGTGRLKHDPSISKCVPFQQSGTNNTLVSLAWCRVVSWLSSMKFVIVIFCYNPILVSFRKDLCCHFPEPLTHPRLKLI